MKILYSFAVLLALSNSFASYSQNNEALTQILQKSFQVKDSSGYYFKKAKDLLKTKKDSADYYYFKFYKYQDEKLLDSAFYYAAILIGNFDTKRASQHSHSFYYRLSDLHLDIGNYDKSLENNQEAIAISQALKDTVLISRNYNVRSLILHDFEHYEEGVFYGKKAFDIALNMSNPSYIRLQRANNSVGINFDDWNKPDSALYYHRKNFEYLDKLDSIEFKNTYNNIGNTLLKQKKYEEAKPFILKALKFDILSNDTYGKATTYTNLTNISYNLNENQNAKRYLDSALVNAYASQSVEKIRDVVLQEALFYKSLGNYKKALERQEVFFEIRDSIFKINRANKVAELETRFQTAQKEVDLAETRATLVEKELDINKKNNMIYGVGGVALLLALLGYLFYNQQRLKNRQQVKEFELENALTKIETQNRLQEQRLRISRDLHDNIGSQLTFITSSLDNLKYGMKEENKVVKDKLTGIGHFTKTTINELRDTIWAMNKESISLEDLESRLGNLLENARKAAPQIQFNLDIDSNIDHRQNLTSVEGMNLYRIIQEAVNNAIKYADAEVVNISLSRKQNQLHTRITDNGKGFDITNTNMGNGLTNMRKRAKDIESTLEITSKQGEGTTVDFTINTNKNTAIAV